MSQGSGFKAVADYASTMLQSYYYTLLYNPTNATQHFGIEQGFFLSSEEIENVEFRDDHCVMLENKSDYHKPCQVYCHNRDGNKILLLLLFLARAG